jgi:hypothetical protein
MTRHTEYVELMAKVTAETRSLDRLEKAIAGRAREMAAKYPILPIDGSRSRLSDRPGEILSNGLGFRRES